MTKMKFFKYLKLVTNKLRRNIFLNSRKLEIDAHKCLLMYI